MKVVYIKDREIIKEKKVKRKRLCEEPVMVAWAKREIVKHFIQKFGK